MEQMENNFDKFWIENFIDYCKEMKEKIPNIESIRISQPFKTAELKDKKNKFVSKVTINGTNEALITTCYNKDLKPCLKKYELNNHLYSVNDIVI